MDFINVGTLRGLGTVLVFVAFVAVALWAYSSKRKSDFDEAANLPFADEPAKTTREEQASRSKNE